MSLTLFLTSLAFGFRHGFDWDHVAAISDLCGSTDSRRRGFNLSFLYALGHAVVVFALGAAAIAVGARLPSGVDAVMGRVVGITLIVLGLWVLADMLVNREDVRLRGRWMLLYDAVHGAWSRVRHRHSADLAPTSDGPATHRRAARRYGSSAAVGVGVLHGIGVESPTQIAVFVASTSVGGSAAGIPLLLGWVLGLLLANSALAVIAGFGLLQSRRRPGVRLAVASVVGLLSIGMGALYVVA